ncbi:MAG: metallophosphoesterase family protein, partial [Clostridia bacterium]|nr:metallophosphoesterase family protein [Clostridia bacterium]
LQNQKHTLRFDENGEFRVLVFGDVQATPPAPSERTLNAMETILRREEPDLVLFAGDNAIACSTTTLLRNYLTAMTGYLEENEIPWAHVYGNHDDENALSRKQQQVIYEEFDYCVSQAGPDDIKGVGNYVLPVYSADESRTDPVFSVWGLDSGGYITDPGLPGKQAVLNNTMYQGLKGSSYAYIPFTQIRWYFNTSEEIESFAGHKVPGMMFFHIPLQEFYEIWLNKEQTGTEGTREDPICAGPLNSGLFTAMVERGDIKAVVCGHDHINDYAGEFCGIQLCYASNIGYDTYHNEALMGGRVFVIHEDDPDEVETYMSYVSGIKLTNLAGAITAVADFEAADSYTVTDNAQASDGGESGSKAVTIAREGGVTLTAPLRLGSGRYLRAWVSVPADSELQSLSLVNYDDIRFTADVTKTEIHYLPDGESEWKTAAAGEGLPAGFTGLVAAPCADLKASHGQLLADSIVKGYYFTCDGSVIVDNVRMLTSYKK